MTNSLSCESPSAQSVYTHTVPACPLPTPAGLSGAPVEQAGVQGPAEPFSDAGSDPDQRRGWVSLQPLQLQPQTHIYKATVCSAPRQLHQTEGSRLGLGHPLRPRGQFRPAGRCGSGTKPRPVPSLPRRGERASRAHAHPPSRTDPGRDRPTPAFVRPGPASRSSGRRSVLTASTRQARPVSGRRPAPARTDTAPPRPRRPPPAAPSSAAAAPRPPCPPRPKPGRAGSAPRGRASGQVRDAAPPLRRVTPSLPAATRGWWA